MIEKKKKECKGTYKVDYFKGCGDELYIYKFGLCNSCFMSWCFSSEKGKEYYANQFKPAANKKLNNESKLDKINYVGKLQEKVQEIARLIDIGHHCLARNKMALMYDGGHCFGKGSSPECRFNLHNIFAQDYKSNQSTKEDALMTEGLRREFGEDYFNFVESLKNKPPQKHLKPEIAKMYKRACTVANSLRNEGKVRSKEERISLRNEINIKIGFYPTELCIYEY